MTKKRSASRKAEPVGLIRVLDKPPPEVEAVVQRIRRWVQEGLPPATDGNYLSSRCGPIISTILRGG